MGMYKNKKPIVTAFRNAGKLCNEWRDTLFYTGVVGVGIADKFYGWGIPMHTIIFSGFLRENARAIMWSEPAPLGNYKHTQSAQLSFSGLGTATFGVYVSNHLNALPMMLPVFMCYAIIAGRAYLLRGGIKNIINDYKDTLFDYPRKKEGPTITRRIKQKLSDMSSDAKNGLGELLPQPGLVPIPIRINRYLQLIR